MKPCTACRAPRVRALADFGDQPVCHHFFNGGEPEVTHPMALGICEACGLTQILDPIPPARLLPRVDWISYNEPEAHLDTMVEMLRQLPGITPESRIAGVTYKEDTTLRRFREQGYPHTWRMDLATDLDIADPRAGVETINDRLVPSRVERWHQKYGSPDLVIVRHIMEHTLDTPAFLETFRRLVKPTGYVVFEGPDCVRGFDLLDYTTLWEDHTLYFVPETFVGTVERNGFSLVKFELYRAAYENLLVAVTRPDAAPRPVKLSAGVLAEETRRAEGFAKGFETRRRELRTLLQAWRKRGRLGMFGAGHHSAIFINVLGLGDLIDFVVDDHPQKCGRWMPGCRLPIVPSATLNEPDVALCLSTLSAESEKKVAQKLSAYIGRGGAFASIFPVKPGELLTHVAGPGLGN